MNEKPEALRLAQELNVASLGIRGCLEAVSADAMLRQHAEIERLKAENEVLRLNDARYRWMKRAVNRIPPGWGLVGWDAAIDAAMQEDKT